MYQAGSKAWATPAMCSSTLASDAILHHYYDQTNLPIGIFTAPAPAAPGVTWRRPSGTSAAVHVESKGAWAYQVQKWNGTSWVVVLNTRVANDGSLQNEFIDTVTQGLSQDYIAWANNPGGGWSPSTATTVPTWTTDLWNASFENSYAGNGAWFWAGNNSPTTSLAGGFDGWYSLEFSPPAGNYASIFQERPFHSTVCPRVVARRPVGYGSASVTLTVWSLPSAAQLTMSYTLPSDGSWYYIDWGSSGSVCRTFTSATDSIVRLEFYNSSTGPIDMDQVKLLYDATTFGIY